MAKSQTQISAFISEATRQELDRYVHVHGVKKGFVVESALQHYLHALRELPADVIIPPRVVVSPETMADIAALLSNPPEPTAAMRRLFKDDDASLERSE